MTLDGEVRDLAEEYERDATLRQELVQRHEDHVAHAAVHLPHQRRRGT